MDKKTEDCLDEIRNKIELLEGQFEGRISLLRTTIKYLSDRLKALEYNSIKNQITLEVGKFYKTRDGKKAVIISNTHCKNTQYPFFGAVIGDNCTQTWNKQGKINNDTECIYDIIEEWED